MWELPDPYLEEDKFRQQKQQVERLEDRACAVGSRNSKQNKVAGARRGENGSRHLAPTWSEKGGLWRVGSEE